MLAHSDPNRVPTYRRVLELQQKAFDLKDPRITRVAIPYEGTTLPAYFSPAPATDDGPAPVIVLVNGLDSTKEHMYSSGHWAELAARGISCLMLDQPGTGEALRLQGLTARIDTEAWAGAAVDLLETRDDVDADRIGIVGWSLGGYYAPRAAAFEKRLALCVAWGANHNWGAVQRRRLEREGERPVPHYWEHVLWVWGHDDLETFIEFADGVHLDGVVEQITVPFLVAHGAERPADPARVRPPLLRAGGQQPQARAAGLHPRGGRDRAHRPRPPAPREHLHRRLGRRHLRRGHPVVVNTGHPISVRHAAGSAVSRGPTR